MKQYLAIDIGGTAVKLGIVDEEGRVLSRTEQSVCFDKIGRASCRERV